MRASPSAHPSPVLTEVLERERELAELLASAEGDAQAILEKAADRATACRARIEDEVAAAVRELEAEHAESCKQAVERKKAEILAELRRIESVDNATIGQLAEHVLALAVAEDD